MRVFVFFVRVFVCSRVCVRARYVNDNLCVSYACTPPPPPKPSPRAGGWGGGGGGGGQGVVGVGLLFLVFFWVCLVVVF